MKKPARFQLVAIGLVLLAAAGPVSAAVSITSAPPPGGGVGVPYHYIYTDSLSYEICLSGSHRFSLGWGALPPGLSLSSGINSPASLSGTPTKAGTYTGMVSLERVCDGRIEYATQVFDIVIVDTPPAFTVAGGNAPVGSVGAPYTFSITAIGTTPITFNLTGGALPDGLTLSTAGLVNGTPTKMGSFAATVTAHNGILPDATMTFIFAVAGPEPHITSAAPPGGPLGVPYTFSYAATGSTPITFDLTSGSLPYGLTLSAAGIISGTPTTSGTFTGTVTASNGISPDSTQDFSITIAVPPTFTNGPPPDGTIGMPYAFGFTASGAPPIAYSVTAGALPDGLALSAGGRIEGTPLSTGVYVGTITASNGTAPDALQPFSITIVQQGPPHITSSPPPGGPVGNPYRFAYKATGASASYLSFYVSGGALPPGLLLTSDGVISGTPTTVGTYPGSVTATTGLAPDDTQPFSITIAAAPPVITSKAPPSGAVGTPYAFVYAAMGSTPMAFSVTAGGLPGGLTLTRAGYINGTPTAAGTFKGTVTVSNGVLPNATQDFSIVVQGTSVPVGAAGSSGSRGGDGALDIGSLLALLLSLAARRRRAAN